MSPAMAGDTGAILTILAEMTYPEYRERHLFTARLRLLIFFGFLIFYAIALTPALPATHPAVIVVTVAGIVTACCYYNILIGRWLLLSFAGELCADLVSISSVVYLLGGPNSDFFLLYVCYSLTAGLFYNYRIAGIVSIASLLAYFGLLGVTLTGMLPPACVLADCATIGTLPRLAGAYAPWITPMFLGLLLALGIYGVRTAQEFNGHRERSLEARNRELLSLQRIGGIIRGQPALGDVVERILREVMGGLDLTGCLLLLVDPVAPRLRCYAPRRWELRERIETLLGHNLTDFTLPLNADNALLQQLSERRAFFRRDLTDLFQRTEPPVPAQALRDVEALLDLRKVAFTPLVTEGELLGALVSLSDEPFLEETAITSLEVFADQAALILRVTLLIDALQTANRDLMEANRVKSEFLATMSHELRTPLTAIIGFSELLYEGAMGAVTTTQQESLREIMGNGANLLELINNILDLARMESGRMALTLETFDLRALLERTQRTVGSLLARKQLHFALHADAQLPPMVGDERRMQQIVMNLLGNAIKFTPDGGHITMVARYAEALPQLQPVRWQEHVTAPDDFADGVFLVQVHDSGIGIPPSHLQSIFEMFKQVDSSVTRRYEGTGLGLALVRQLIELHGGTIWAESEPGHGATFFCLIPRHRPGPADAHDMLL